MPVMPSSIGGFWASPYSWLKRTIWREAPAEPQPPASMGPPSYPRPAPPAYAPQPDEPVQQQATAKLAGAEDAYDYDRMLRDLEEGQRRYHAGEMGKWSASPWEHLAGAVSSYMPAALTTVQRLFGTPLPAAVRAAERREADVLSGGDIAPAPAPGQVPGAYPTVRRPMFEQLGVNIADVIASDFSKPGLLFRGPEEVPPEVLEAERRGMDIGVSRGAAESVNLGNALLGLSSTVAPGLRVAGALSRIPATARLAPHVGRAAEALGAVTHYGFQPLNVAMVGTGAEEVRRGMFDEELTPIERARAIGQGVFSGAMGAAFGLAGARRPQGRWAREREMVQAPLEAAAARSEMMRPTPLAEKPAGWTPRGTEITGRPPTVPPAPAGPAPTGPVPPPGPPAPPGAPPAAGPPPPAGKVPASFTELRAAMMAALQRGDTAELERLGKLAEASLARTRAAGVESAETGPLLTADALTQNLGPIEPTGPPPPVTRVGQPIIYPNLQVQPALRMEHPTAARPAPAPPPAEPGVVRPEPTPGPPSPPGALAPAEGGVGFRAIRAPFTGGQPTGMEADTTRLVQRMAEVLKGRDLYELAGDPAAMAEVDALLRAGRAHDLPPGEMVRMAQSLLRGESPTTMGPARSGLDELLARARQTEPYDPTYWRGVGRGGEPPPPPPTPPEALGGPPAGRPPDLASILGPPRPRPPTPVRTIPGPPLAEGFDLAPPAQGPPPPAAALTRQRMLPRWWEGERYPTRPAGAPPPPPTEGPAPAAPKPPPGPVTPPAAPGLPEGVTSGAVLATKTPERVLKLDPIAYQFKRSDLRGVVLKGGLEGVTEWDPSSPPIMVHERADGSLYIADGHQRFALYSRLKAAGADLPPLEFRVYREADGYSVSDMRRTAALHNIQGGSADPMDIAKLLREGPLTDGERARLPKGADNERAARWIKGERLSRLGEPAWRMVVDERVSPDFANYVVNHIQGDAEQLAALKLLARSSRITTEAQADSFFASVAEHGFGEAPPDAQGELPGFEKAAAQIPVFEQAGRLEADALKELRTRRAAFSAAVRHADRLAAAGNELIPDVNIAQMNEAAKAKAVFENFAKFRGTHTRGAINALAPKLVDGSIGRAEAIDEVLAALQRDIEGIAAGPGAAAPPPVPGGERPPDLGRPEPPTVPPVEPPEPRAGPPPERPPSEAKPREAPVEAPPPAEETAPPDEARKILEDMERVINAPPQQVAETPPLQLTPMEETAPVTRRELERRGQGSIFEEPKPPETAPPPKPPEAPPEAPTGPPPPEPPPPPLPPAAPGAARRPPADQTPATPPGGKPWEEHPNGWAVDPESKDFIAVKLPRMADGHSSPELRQAIRDLGGRFRKNVEQWFIDVNDATREPTMDRVREILRREVAAAEAAAPPPAEAPAAPPPEAPKPKSIEEILKPPAPPEAPPPAVEKPSAPEMPDSSAEAPKTPTTYERLTPNQKSYLKQRAGLSDEQINAMTYEEVVEYGRAHGERAKAAKEAAQREAEARAAAEQAAKPPEAEAPPPEAPPTEKPPEQRVGRPREEEWPPELKEYRDFLDRHLGTEAPIDYDAALEVANQYPHFFAHRLAAMRRGAERIAALQGRGRATARQMRGEQLTPLAAKMAGGQREAQAWATPIGEEVSPAGKPRSQYAIETPQFTRAEIEEFVELAKNYDAWKRAGEEAARRPPRPVQQGQAAERARLLAKGDPVSLQRYRDLLWELQEREYAIQARNFYSEAKAQPPPRGEGGEFVGADFGLMNLASTFRQNPEKFFHGLRLIGIPASTFVGAGQDPENRLRGAIRGLIFGALATSRKTYQAATYQQLAKRGRTLAALTGKPPAAGTMHPIRAERKAGDIGWHERWLPFTPERVVPDVFRKVQPIFDELNRLAEEPAFPAALRKVAVRAAHREAAGLIREYGKVAADTGLRRRAAYLRELADAVAGKPTGLGLKVKKLLTELGVKEADTKWLEGHIGSNVYRVLTGYALDTAVQNLSQPILALRFVGPADLLWAYRMGRTPWGKAMAAHTKVTRPIDMIEDILGIVETKPVEEMGGLKGWVKDPQRFLWLTDQWNRRVTYLAALRKAQRSGLNHAAADDWAQQVMRATQGHYGPLSFNPSWRGPIGGSIRPFMKFPGLLIENFADVLSQPDVGGRSRFLLTLAGAALAGRALGLDFEDMLLMGGRPLGIDILHPEETVQKALTGQLFPVGRAAKSLATTFGMTGEVARQNVLIPRIVEREGLAKAIQQPVELLEDILGTSAGYYMAGRYPAKLTGALIRTGREGFGPHTVPQSTGAPTVITGKEELANLLGLKSTEQTKLSDVYREMGRELRTEEVSRSTAITFLRRDLGAAIARKDYEAVTDILRQLAVVGQSIQTPKNALKAVTRQRYERMLREAPPAKRGKMEELFGREARELEQRAIR